MYLPRLLHRLVRLHVIEKYFVTALSGITEGVNEKGRFAGLVERLWNADIIHQLVIDENRDAVQVATDPDAVDILG